MRRSRVCAAQPPQPSLRRPRPQARSQASQRRRPRTKAGRGWTVSEHEGRCEDGDGDLGARAGGDDARELGLSAGQLRLVFLRFVFVRRRRSRPLRRRRSSSPEARELPGAHLASGARHDRRAPDGRSRRRCLPRARNSSAGCAAFDLACSRFRDDSELSLLNRSPGQAVPVGEILWDALRGRAFGRRADWRPRRSDGGTRAAPRRLRPLVHAREPPQRTARRRCRASLPGDTRRSSSTATRRTVRLPVGVELDLGATAKAVAADRIAAAAADCTDSGVLVSLGGDIAVAGEPLEGGWPVRIADDHRGSTRPAGADVALSAGRACDLQHDGAAVADSARRVPPHRRPPHRPPGDGPMADGDRRRKLVRRGQHRKYGRDRPRRRRARLARATQPSGPARR